MKRIWGLISGGAIALFLVSPSAAIPAGAAAPCESSSDSQWNPYTASTAEQAACGLVAIPASSTTPMAGGGELVTYSRPAGDLAIVSFPANFDPSTASASQLAEYGLPAEPPVSNANARASWVSTFDNVHFGQPPSALLASTTTKFVSKTCPSGTQCTAPWSGYIDQESAGYFHYAWGEFTVGNQGGCSCLPNVSGGFWVGLGGWNNMDLGQAGLAMGQYSGFGEDQAWYEQTDQGGPIALPLSGSPGYPFTVDVSYGYISAKGWYGYTYVTVNDHTGSGYVTYAEDYTYNGSTTDFIAEGNDTKSVSGPWLPNFGTVYWDYVGSASQQNPLTDYPHTNLTLQNPLNGDILATTSGLQSGGTYFNSYWQACT